MPSKFPSLCLLTAILLLLQGLCKPAPPQALALEASNKLDILFISSFSKNIPAQAEFESGLDRSLEFSKGRTNLYFEFMDIPRLNEKNINAIFPGFLQKKYEAIEFDLVVGWADAACNILPENTSLFANAHRVYVEGPTEGGDNGLADPGKETEIVIQDDYRKSLQEVVRLESPKKIFVIGTTRDKVAQERITRFQNSLADTEHSLIQVEYLLDQPMEQVAETLERIPAKDTVAFYLLMFSDGKGVNMTPYDVVQHLASRSAVPIYSYWESLMGSGVVGGYVLSVEMIGYHLGKSFLSISRGEEVAEFSPLRHVYDWNALLRWELTGTELPAEAIVLNRPPDILQHYLWQIVSTGVVFIVLSILSLFLIRALKLRNTAVHELDLERKNLKKMVAARTEELVTANTELQYTLDEVKTLRGILPLCSFCKKIRNDQGDWEEIETYINIHSEADISHSVCPECLKKHYPEVHQARARDWKE
jgi:hypothetical protein